MDLCGIESTAPQKEKSWVACEQFELNVMENRVLQNNTKPFTFTVWFCMQVAYKNKSQKIHKAASNSC